MSNAKIRPFVLRQAQDERILPTFRERTRAGRNLVKADSYRYTRPMHLPARLHLSLTLLALAVSTSCSSPQPQGAAVESRFAERMVQPFFQAVERTSPGALIDLVHPDFRTSIDNTQYDIGRFTELLRYDPENIENRVYRFDILRASEMPDGRTRVDVEYSFRARIKRSGEEWQTADRTATLYLLDDKLIGISGDRPFGMSDRLGVLYVRDGTVARNSPGPYSSIKQGTYTP